nr:hypothetical protein GCM10020093_096520 [Planobispora longispora]
MNDMNGLPTARTDEVRPRVAVSSCLIGELVRFNGGHSRDRFLSGELDPYVDWVPVCPEMEIGLGAPGRAFTSNVLPRAPGSSPGSRGRTTPRG